MALGSCEAKEGRGQEAGQRTNIKGEPRGHNERLPPDIGMAPKLVD